MYKYVLKNLDDNILSYYSHFKKKFSRGNIFSNENIVLPFAFHKKKKIVCACVFFFFLIKSTENIKNFDKNFNL